jgi:predicted Zn-dependent protease with MMP-like domain
MHHRTFEHLVAQVLDDLPREFQDKLDNVEIVVEDWPDQRTMQLAGVRSKTQLLGFYHGIPQSARAITASSCRTRSAYISVPLKCAAARWRR